MEIVVKGDWAHVQSAASFIGLPTTFDGGCVHASTLFEL